MTVVTKKVFQALALTLLVSFNARAMEEAERIQQLEQEKKALEQELQKTKARLGETAQKLKQCTWALNESTSIIMMDATSISRINKYLEKALADNTELQQTNHSLTATHEDSQRRLETTTRAYNNLVKVNDAQRAYLSERQTEGAVTLRYKETE